jgi:hypothetical protein
MTGAGVFRESVPNGLITDAYAKYVPKEALENTQTRHLAYETKVTFCLGLKSYDHRTQHLFCVLFIRRSRGDNPRTNYKHKYD